MGVPRAVHDALNREQDLRDLIARQQQHASRVMALEDVQRIMAIANGQPNIVGLAPIQRVGLDDHAVAGAPMVPHVLQHRHPETLLGPKPPEVFDIGSDDERDPRLAHAEQLKRMTAPLLSLGDQALSFSGSPRASASKPPPAPASKPVKKDNVKTRRVGKQKPRREDFLLQAKEPTAKELKRAGFGADEALDILIQRKRLASM
jgi:hypothetical protein